jgi:asparagine synthase (glutamine-hydrolysing)
MCGIAGIITSNGAAPNPALLQALVKALSHRGPDGHGEYVKDNVGFIQTRLAIIDLVTGDQPLFDTNGSVLIANGEIYNYIELRAAMPDVHFVTQSDCEIPLYLYRKDGVRFAQKLRGMYAIAIHDLAKQQLILARDPFGIKPLYYAVNEQGLMFASEPRAIIDSGFIKLHLSSVARVELLRRHYTTGNEIIYDGIKRVMPGETLVISKGTIIERHTIKALHVKKSAVTNEDAAIQELDRVLEDSVRVHQRSDVPYGMFLSGGIDSSTVLAMMARCNNKPVKAFTAGFTGTKVADERQDARRVAESFGAEHIEVEFSEEDFWTLLPAVAAALDDPTTDYATLPTYKLAAVARASGTKVILSGEGGDELFGGYGRYRRAMRPWWFGGRMQSSASDFDGLGVFRESPSAKAEEINVSLTDHDADLTRLQKVQAIDCQNWLPNDLLTKLDRCLMAHGVEGRTPFLDPVMAEYAFNLPDYYKVNNGLGKWILRKWLQKYAPVAEPFAKKRGFTVPVREWIVSRADDLGKLVSQQRGIKAFSNQEEVRSVFQSARDKKTGYAAWGLLFYALWYRIHIEKGSCHMDIFDTLEC